METGVVPIPPLGSILHHPVSTCCGHAVEQIFAILSSFFVFNGPFFKYLLNFLQWFFFFFFASGHVRPYLTKQRLNPHPLHWKVKS